jgi:hypothetical protein
MRLKYSVFGLLLGLAMILSFPGCAVCKSSDTIEQCRTKERNHSQPRVEFSLGNP